MHIWYIHHYGGGPGIGLYDRPYQLAKAWQHLGHSATIFIAEHHHLLEASWTPQPDWYVDGVRYISVPARPYSGNGMLRLLNIWDFSKNLYRAGQDVQPAVPPPDAIIVSSPHPFSIFSAHALARRYGAKLVFEIRDIWPLSITEIMGTSRLHPFVQMCAAAERFALKHSDLVASVLPRADRYLADRGYGDKPFVWVPNGVGKTEHGRRDSFASEEAHRAYVQLENWRSQQRTTIIYVGSIGKPNAVDLLVSAMALGNSRGFGDIYSVMIVGKGDSLEDLKNDSIVKNMNNVYFSGRIPKCDALNLLFNADIGYAGLRNIENLFCYGVSPNKIADYFSASLPTFLPLSPCGDPVSESGGGIARRAETPEEVWKALQELILMPPSARRSLGEKGKEYMRREYDYDRIARRYVEAIQDCVSGDVNGGCGLRGQRQAQLQ